MPRGFRGVVGGLIMRRFGIALVAGWLLAAAPAALAAADSDPMKQVGALHWVHGPAAVQVGDVARIKLPAGPMFIGKDETSKFLELNGNPPSDDNYTVSAPDYSWFAVFAFDPVGYVKDDEAIDADALLATLKEQDAADSEERKRLGLAALRLDGWSVKPHYDSATHNLEWGTRLVNDKGEVTVNYTSRILSRSGVMRATLVSDPGHLQDDIVKYRKVLAGFDFNAGERYGEWRDGDKVAGYGLAALVTGGAAAAAVKGGFFKPILVALAAGWKLVLAGLAALAAAVNKLFGRRGKPD